MILAGLIAGFVVLLGTLLSIGGVYYVAKRKLRRAFLTFVQSPSAGVASPFAIFCQSLAEVFGSALSRSLKATFMGVESVEAKRESREATTAAISGSPLLAMILQSFPALGKKLNPAMAMLAGDMLKKVAERQPTGGGGNHNTPTNAVRFKF